MKHAAQRIVIGEFPMIRFSVRVGSRAHAFKICSGHGSFVWRQSALGRSAGTEQQRRDCNQG